MNCPYCGADNQDYSCYCGHCAKELPKTSEINPTTVTCPNCGKANRKRASYCDSCGSNMNREARQQSPTRAYPLESLVWWRWLFAIGSLGVTQTALVILGIAWGIYWLSICSLVIGAIFWVLFYVLLKSRP